LTKENWQKTARKIDHDSPTFCIKMQLYTSTKIKSAFDFKISLSFTSAQMLKYLTNYLNQKKSNILQYESTGAKVAFIRVKLKPVWFAFTG